MSYLDRAIEIESAAASMCRVGFLPENLEHHERRIKELQAQREQEHREYLESRAIEERMTTPKLREPTCVAWMNPDQYFDTRGELREQRYVPGKL